MLKRYRIIIIALVSIALLLSITACTNNKQKSGVTAETTTAELNDAEMASLMRQVADSDVSRSYGEYLKDEAFADAEVFGIERDGDQGTAYAYLYDGEYVVFKDKAYEMSGSAGEAMIKFVYGEDDVTLSEIIWSADGGEHENWMKENFPAEALRRAKNYKAYDSNGKSILGSKVNESKTQNLIQINDCPLRGVA